MQRSSPPSTGSNPYTARCRECGYEFDAFARGVQPGIVPPHPNSAGVPLDVVLSDAIQNPLMTKYICPGSGGVPQLNQDGRPLVSFLG